MSVPATPGHSAERHARQPWLLIQRILHNTCSQPAALGFSQAGAGRCEGTPKKATHGTYATCTERTGQGDQHSTPRPLYPPAQ